MPQIRDCPGRRSPQPRTWGLHSSFISAASFFTVCQFVNFLSTLTFPHPSSEKFYDQSLLTQLLWTAMTSKRQNEYETMVTITTRFIWRNEIFKFLLFIWKLFEPKAPCQQLVNKWKDNSNNNSLSFSLQWRKVNFQHWRFQYWRLSFSPILSSVAKYPKVICLPCKIYWLVSTILFLFGYGARVFGSLKYPILYSPAVNEAVQDVKLAL